MAVPRYIEAVECSRATGAFSFLSIVAGAQERYCAKSGHYAARLADLDIDAQLPESFVACRIQVPCVGFGAAQGWTLAEPSADDSIWQEPRSDKQPPVAPGQQFGWRLCVRRVGFAAGLGEYTLVFSHRGFEAADSTVPDEIAPASSTRPDDDEFDEDGESDEDEAPDDGDE